MRRRLGVVVVVFLAVTGLLVAGAASAPAWDRVSDHDGLLVEHRAVPGSRLGEVRVTAQSPVAPAAVFETLWKHHEYLEFVPFLKRLTLLSDSGDERVAYEQLALPFVKDRDYTVRFRRRMDPATHRYEISIEGANEAGPPPDGTHVRVTDIRGRWSTEPGPGGKGSVVRYEIRSDPGGRIPAWVADRTMRHAATDLMRAVLRRASEKQAGK